ncbi:hypothetical protein BDC45DRAFT_534713 [Circinella umbellata]|nr:hypothetical protein BDC45DRAFT_534713 [Circinella umbellata]
MSNGMDDNCQTLCFHDWIVIVCTAACILAILFIVLGFTVLIFTRRGGRKSSRKRGSCMYCDGANYDPERQSLLHGHQHTNNDFHPEMKRTPTYYQWNKPSFSQQNENLSSLTKAKLGSREEHCWHQRREALLRRFAAD